MRQAFSYSFLSRTCPREQYLSELMPPTEPHPNMELGTVGHAVLNEFFRAKKPNVDHALSCQAMKDLEAKYEGTLDSPVPLLTKALTKYMLLHMPLQSPQVTAQWWMPMAHDIKGAIEPADGKYILGEMPLIIDMAEELGFDKPTPIKLIPDLIKRHTKSDVLSVVDFKFTGSPLTAYLGERFNLGFQVPLYIYALRKVTGLDIQQGIIEAIYIGKENTQWKWGDRYSYTPVIRWTRQEEERLFEWMRARILEYRWRCDNGLWPEIGGALYRQKICKSCDFRSICGRRYGDTPAVARALRLTEGSVPDPL